MATSVSGYWPGITDEQRDSLTGFDNDCKAWGDWMAERFKHPDVLDTMMRLGVGGLLSHITEGVKEDEVDWAAKGQPHPLKFQPSGNNSTASSVTRWAVNSRR